MVCLYTALVLLQIVALITARSVVVDVKADWPRYSTSYVAEVAEFIAAESRPWFWIYVDSVCTQSERIERILISSTSSDDSTSGLDDLQALAFELGAEIVPDSFHGFMDTLIGLNAYAPMLRFFESMAQHFGNPCNGRAFVALYPSDKVVCNIADLKFHLSSSSWNASFQVVEHDWDHLYPTSLDNEQPSQLAVLYGSLGTSSFCAFHDSLSKEASSPSTRIRYAVRHSFAGVEKISEETRIQGYGVFLDTKNMEYKNYDDSKGDVASSTDSSGGDLVSFLADEEVLGVNFATLASRYPNLHSELSVLRAELREKAAGAASEMKVWKMKDLGLQTLQLLRSVPSAQVIEKLEDIVSNFPMHAPAISAVRVSNSVRDDVILAARLACVSYEQFVSQWSTRGFVWSYI